MPSNQKGLWKMVVSASWIIDTLRDIREFSEVNKMKRTASAVDQAILVALSEIDSELSDERDRKQNNDI